MNRRYIASILFLLTTAIVDNVNAFASYKWVSLKPGDPLPENIVLMKRWHDFYVARAKRYGKLQLAVVNANREVFIDGEQIESDFEILTSTGECGWAKPSRIVEYQGDLVRIGTKSYNGAPTFLKYFVSIDYNYDDYKNNELDWSFDLHVCMHEGNHYLYCNTTDKWIAYSPNMILPSNQVSGGTFEDSEETFVARSKLGSNYEIGQFVLENGNALFGNRRITKNFDILIGQPNEYSWVSGSNGTIPEYAVQVYFMDYEPVYVAQINTTIRNLTHFMACFEPDYKILVINQPTANYSTSASCRFGISYLLTLLVTLTTFIHSDIFEYLQKHLF